MVKGKRKKESKTAETGEVKAQIIPINLEDEMKHSYIDYAMSVIVGRALPDVRDGLKPVHRRILFAMDELGLGAGRAYKKSARVVGEVLGKYHPHGDTAVYESMVRMAQDFSLRYRLVDGQGNFGSVDGDSPAAMRYTEARMTRIAEEMLSDIEKDTVNFIPNFDESLKEPSVLPSKFPNLLVNGSSGIAVGMATNIPPHNLAEVVDGIIHVIDEPEVTLEELMKDIKGPDFPTGAIICGRKGIKDAFSTGRGLVTLRARVNFEELRGGKEAIIITELPYQVNKASLVEQIANLVKNKKIVGIIDLRDESDRDGMRVYIELRRDANREIVLNQLYKHTDMQATFGINMVALVGGEPIQLTIKQLIEEFVKYREEVVTRRTKFDLNKAKEDAHILEGLKIAVENIDAIVKLIKSSKNPDEARNGLMTKFKLSERQAQAILDMRLQRLTQLERHKIEEDYANLLKLIVQLEAILASRKKMQQIIKEELMELRKKYGDPRRSEITGAIEEMVAEDLIPDVEVAIPLTLDGFIKRMPMNMFRSQQRGGRGVAGMTTSEQDQIYKIFVATTHNDILFFSNKGKVHKVKAYEIPEAGRAAKGTSVANLLSLGQGEMVTAAISVKEFDPKHFMFMTTRGGVVKKVPLEEFEHIRRAGIIAIKLREADELRWVRLTDGKQSIVMGTETGMLIQFNENDVRPMGRAAAGVRGITLQKEDKVVCMGGVSEGNEMLFITKNGYGKRTEIEEYRSQHRGGKGLCAIRTRPDDRVVSAKIVNKDDDILVITANGTLSRQSVEGISLQGRYAKGVRVQKLDRGDAVSDLARVVKTADLPDGEQEDIVKMTDEEGAARNGGKKEEKTKDEGTKGEKKQQPKAEKSKLKPKAKEKKK